MPSIELTPAPEPVFRHYATPENPLQPRLRVALINPPDPATDIDTRVKPPLGLGYVAAMARMRGYHADIFDLVGDLGIDRSGLAASGLPGDYDVYGFGTYTESFEETVRILRMIRAERPESRFLLGGYHATIASQQVMADYPEVDAIVLNEGEYACADLLDAWASGGCDFGALPGVLVRRSGQVVAGQGVREQLDQDRLPYPVLDVRYGSMPYADHIDMRRRRLRRVLPVVSSRGCPKRCTFCAIIVMSPKWRARSVESLMREIRYRYAIEPFDHVAFLDANFFVDTRRTVAFSEALFEFNPDITWSGTATADHIDRHRSVLGRIGELNCGYLEVGIESGNDRSLGRFNKWTTAELNARVLQLLSAAHIPIGLDFIMFEPVSTMQDIEENFRFMCDNELVGYWPPGLLFSSLKLYPGTPIRDTYAEAHPGVDLPVHRIPRVGYDDPVVATFVRALDVYWARMQATTNRLVQDLQRLTSDALAPGDNSVCDRRLVQQALAVLIRLQHLPYRIFEQYLGGGRPPSASEEPLALLSRLGFEGHLEVQQRARQLLAELADQLPSPTDDDRQPARAG